jgi:hypothetical protein
MASRARGDRKFAPLPPGIVRVRLEGESAPGLAAQLTGMPGVQVVTGPDEYPGGRLYLTVAVSEQEVPGVPSE